MVGAVGFNTYSANIDDMFDVIVDSLVLSNPSKFEKISVGDFTDRSCVKILNENKYILFRSMPKYKNGSYFYTDIGISIGSNWDDVNCLITSPEDYRACLYGQIGWDVSEQVSDADAFINRIYSHTVYIDEFGIFWNIYNPYTDGVANGVNIIIEFVPTSWKEYNDGASSIIIRNTTYPNMSSLTTKGYHFGQPSVVQTDTDMIDLDHYELAFKSSGNNKIYFNFPRVHNFSGLHNNVIYQTRRFFFVSKIGLAVNDVISWIDVDGTTIRKFIVLDLGGARGTRGDYYIAFPFDNAAQYE